MQFMFGVGGYIIARVLAILLPLFFVNQPGQEDLAIRIVLILENIVLWGFLGALAYIFRCACPQRFSRQANVCILDMHPYHMLCTSMDVVLRWVMGTHASCPWRWQHASRTWQLACVPRTWQDLAGVLFGRLAAS